MTAEATPVGADTFCTFYLDGHCFGIEVGSVQEVIRYLEMTRVPLAPPEVRGLINLRGQLVTALDLRRRLDLPDPPADRTPLNVVVGTEDGAVSFLVDEIGDVLDVPAGCFEPPPETLPAAVRDVIRAAAKLETRLMVVLDVARVIDLSHRQPPASSANSPTGPRPSQLRKIAP